MLKLQKGSNAQLIDASKLQALHIVSFAPVVAGIGDTYAHELKSMPLLLDSIVSVLLP